MGLNIGKQSTMFWKPKVYCERRPAIAFLQITCKCFFLKRTMPSKRTLKRMCKGSPGLVVTGGDSCSNGREFESQLVTYLFVVKFVMCV